MEFLGNSGMIFRPNGLQWPKTVFLVKKPILSRLAKSENVPRTPVLQRELPLYIELRVALKIYTKLLDLAIFGSN